MPINVSVNISPFSTVETVDIDLRESLREEEQKTPKEEIDLVMYVGDKQPRIDRKSGKSILVAVSAELPMTILRDSRVIGRKPPTKILTRTFFVVETFEGTVLSKTLFSQELETKEEGRPTSAYNIHSLHISGFVTLPQLTNLMSALNVHPNLKTLKVNFSPNIQYDELSATMITDRFKDSPLTDLIIIRNGATDKHFQKNSFDFKADSADILKLKATFKPVMPKKIASSPLQKEDKDEKSKSEKLERPSTPVMNTMTETDENKDDEEVTRTGTLEISHSGKGSSSERDKVRGGYEGYASPSPAQAVAERREQKHKYNLRKRKGKNGGDKNEIEGSNAKQLRV